MLGAETVYEDKKEHNRQVAIAFVRPPRSFLFCFSLIEQDQRPGAERQWRVAGERHLRDGGRRAPGLRADAAPRRQAAGRPPVHAHRPGPGPDPQAHFDQVQEEGR